MPLHMHEALENVAGKHHNNKLCYTCTYVHTYTLDTYARVKCVASTYGTYAHSYYECHIITTYTHMLEGEISHSLRSLMLSVSLVKFPDAWLQYWLIDIVTVVIACLSLWRSDVIIYKPGSDVFQNILISMYIHIRAAAYEGTCMHIGYIIHTHVSVRIIVCCNLIGWNEEPYIT